MYNSERIPETSIDQNQTNGCRSDVNSDGTDQYKDPTDSVPSGPSRRIVLHFDLNNTILVSDAVTRQGTVAALEYFLSTVTWGRVKKGKWEWLSEAPSLLQPCEGAITYYTQFGRVAGFTTVGPGRRFRRVLEEHLDLLRWPSDIPADKELSVKGEDGKLYHWILPSFFQMLQDLSSQGLEFSILFRTFGSDLPRVLNAVRRAVEQGSHPLFPNLPALKLRVNVTAGHIKCSSKGATLIRGEDHVSTRDGEQQVYQYLSSAEGLGGFQDNFDWWAQNTYSILGGKPLWIDPFDHKVQHIFIDDNIRQNDEDTIVHPKVFLDPEGCQTRTASTSELYDLCLVQNNLLKAISEPGYFTRRIQICMENYEGNIQKG
uniref:Si:dkey-32e6.3 n=1 Tax=Cyprinus carpio TaxID=7962 RepID=A0A8C1SNW1_CYPCA